MNVTSWLAAPRRASRWWFGFATVLCNCATSLPPTVPFQAPPASSASWKEVFSKPGDAEVSILVTGTVRAPSERRFDLDSPRAGALKPGVMIDGLSLAYLFHHDRFGDFLIDTGLDTSFRHDPCGNVHGLLAKRIFNPMVVGDGQDIGAQLASRRPQLKGVFLTHLHPDHTAGIPALPQGLTYRMGKGEKYRNYPLFFHGDHLDHVSQIELFDFSGQAAMAPLGPAVDIFGDGTLWAIWTPGHSPGHVSYLVNGRGQPLLIVGDASMTEFGFTHDIAPGRVDDRHLADQSFEQLRAFSTEFPQVRLTFGHDLPEALRHGVP